MIMRVFQIEVEDSVSAIQVREMSEEIADEETNKMKTNLAAEAKADPVTIVASASGCPDIS